MMRARTSQLAMSSSAMVRSDMAAASRPEKGSSAKAVTQGRRDAPAPPPPIPPPPPPPVGAPAAADESAPAREAWRWPWPKATCGATATCTVRSSIGISTRAGSALVAAPARPPVAACALAGLAATARCAMATGGAGAETSWVADHTRTTPSRPAVTYRSLSLSTRTLSIVTVGPEQPRLALPSTGMAPGASAGMRWRTYELSFTFGSSSRYEVNSSHVIFPSELASMRAKSCAISRASLPRIDENAATNSASPSAVRMLTSARAKAALSASSLPMLICASAASAETVMSAETVSSSPSLTLKF
jgi:hypothetical protein